MVLKQIRHFYNARLGGTREHQKGLFYFSFHYHDNYDLNF